MDIISLRFAFLAIASIIIYYLINHKYRVGYLTLLSCGFIASFSYILLIYVVVYSTINFYLGLKIPGSRYKKRLFRTGLAFNLLQLVLLKYASFAIDPVFQVLGSDIMISNLSKIIIPVGISFFTLQGIGYLINIKMGWEKPEENFMNFLLFIAFYPKFISGPIERSNHFLTQLKGVRVFNEKNVINGLRIASLGFFKKVAIANQLAPMVNSAYANLGSQEGSTLWIVLLIQPLYLYFDFSGYTNIAIGFGKAFGFDLLPNFNRPFLAENVTTFWKRFHMSLSSWFNDYIFKQVSFKYRSWGIYAAVFALLVTWTLFGIWHGAGWNFMLLGLLQALAMNYEFFTKKWRIRIFSGLPDILRVWIGRVFTYFFYAVSLVFFFSPDFQSVFIYFSKLIVVNDFILKEIPLAVFIVILIFVIAFMIVEILQTDFRKVFDKFEDLLWYNQRIRFKLLRWMFYIFIITVIIILCNKVQNFIYFQF